MSRKILPMVLCMILLITSSGCIFGNGTNVSKSVGSTTAPANTSASRPADDPAARLKAVFEQYIDAWKNNDFKTMYSHVGAAAREAISEENFVNRYATIYKAIGAENLKVVVQYPDTLKLDDVQRVFVDFTVSMDTAAGTIEFTNTAKFREEEIGGIKQWRVLWEETMIFPGLEKGDVVKAATIPSRRGEILDRNGLPLAVEGVVAEIGIIPERLGDAAEESKKAVSELIGMSVDAINKKLNASYVKPNMFIPMKVVSKDETQLLSRLRSISGVSIREKKLRTYPLAEKAAHLTGYMQQINAQELEKLKDEGYTQTDMLGKTGLEKIYEKEFRPENGLEIYIEDKYGNKKQVLAAKDAKKPMELRLSIDANIQSAIYEELKEDKGAGVAINPKTGEVLALVSTPSYNPNSFILGMSSEEWSLLNNSPQKPLFNRFQATFSPGSSFKPVTAAIGLITGKLDPEKDLEIKGLKWQKGSSWGNYFISRVREYPEPSNFLNAMMYSDNIYFAQTALSIGKDNFLSEVKKLGIGEEIPFDFPLNKSQFDSDGIIKNEIQVADSGYGQGEILMNPLQLALIYGAFVNEGNIMKPLLQPADVQSPEVWKSGAIPKEAAKTILEALIQVVSNPKGTGHEAYIEGLTIAGKTGTAEVKMKQGSTTGTEIGWFVAVDAKNPELLVLMMVEDVKGRGGSHYVVPKVKRILEQFAKK